MSKITFSQAKEGYLLAAGARHLSEHTIRDYLNTFKKFSNFLDDDLPLEQITRHHIEAFFAAQTKVSNKTIVNYHVGLSSLWTWAVSERIVSKHVVREVTPPVLDDVVEAAVSGHHESGFGDAAVSHVKIPVDLPNQVAERVVRVDIEPADRLLQRMGEHIDFLSNGQKIRQHLLEFVESGFRVVFGCFHERDGTIKDFQVVPVKRGEGEEQRFHGFKEESPPRRAPVLEDVDGTIDGTGRLLQHIPPRFRCA